MQHTKKEAGNKCRFVESNTIEPRQQVAKNTARMFQIMKGKKGGRRK